MAGATSSLLDRRQQLGRGIRVHVVIPDESETVMAVSSVRGVRPDETLRRDVDALFGRVVTQVAL